MNVRSRVNLLAVVIVAAGGFALSTPATANAAVFGGCEDLEAALDRKAEQCWDLGGSELHYSGSCSSTGYSLNTECYA